MARTSPWKVSDERWERVKPLIPHAPSYKKGGRPRMPDRQAFEAIVSVWHIGIQWNALPRELGAISTIHDHFQEWEQKGLFKALWQAGLRHSDEGQGIASHRWGDDEGLFRQRRDWPHSPRSRQERDQAEHADGLGRDSPGAGG